MRHDSSLWIVIITAVSCVRGPLAVKSYGGEVAADKVIETVLSDWRTRREQSITAKYELTCTSLIPKGSRDGYPGAMRQRPIPVVDVRRHSLREWSIDFVQGLIRKEACVGIHAIPAAEFQPTHSIIVFDGGSLYEDHPRGSNAYWFNHGMPDVIVLDDVESVNSVRSVQDFPVFFAHGIVNAGVPLVPGLPGAHFDEDDFSVHAMDNSPGHSEYQIITLRTRGPYPSAGKVYEYVVDITRDSAILAASVYQDERLRYRIDILWQACAARWWVPRQWRVMVFDDEQRLRHSMDVGVAHVEINEAIRATVFHADLEPNDVVQRNGELFRVGSDGQALNRIRAQEHGDAEGWSLITGVATVASGVVLCVAGILGGRLMRKRTRDSVKEEVVV